MPKQHAKTAVPKQHIPAPSSAKTSIPKQHTPYAETAYAKKNSIRQKKIACAKKIAYAKIISICQKA